MSEPIEMKQHLNPVEDISPGSEIVTEWMNRGGIDHRANPALVFKDVTVSHGELDQRSSRIANYLIGRGVKHGDRVGLCLDRSIEMIAVLVGILKTGAAYVPFDPDYPEERLRMMREEARLRCMVVHSARSSRFDTAAEQLLVWEDICTDIESEKTEVTDVSIDPEDTAYIIFTSGSTGRPKGIAMPHRALSNLIEWQLERKSFKPAARVMQYSSISFDVSFQEVATTIASGGTLCLIDNEDRKDPRKLLRQLTERRIERLFLPYVAMRSLIEAAHAVNIYPETLTEIITAGEQLIVDDAVRTFFSRIPDATLDNQYGPAETHVVTAHLLEGKPADWPDLPPIGTQIRNVSVYLLDDGMQPVEAGETGELYFAGRCVAHGYFGRESLSESAFIPNPCKTSGQPTLYRTGDLASFNSDGLIQFLGRQDHQVKIRGHRIEPGEINSAVTGFPGVEHCITHVTSTSGAAQQLVAYYTVAPGESVSSQDLHSRLSQILPAHMIPAFLLELDEIPFTPSGKADLMALPKPSIEDTQYGRVECQYESETEASLAEIWSGILDLNPIPRSADFFELGGDSLSAVTLFLKIQQRFGKELPLASLSRAPTIETLAVLIEGSADTAPLRDYQALQVIQEGEEGITPVFLIHGGAGNILVFNELAHSLDHRQPVYGFQWTGWNGGRGDKSIPQMVNTYKEELLRFRPSGPYRIGGYCIGGLIAIELANQLKQDGLQVEEPLLIWDAPNLKSPKYRKTEPWGNADDMTDLERLKNDLVRLAIPSAGSDVDAAPEAQSSGMAGLLKKIPGMHPMVRLMKLAREWLPVRLALRAKRPVPMASRPFFCLRTMLAAVRQHKSPVYDGDMLYFRSYSVLGKVMGVPGWWDDPFFGFRELCNGHFDGHVVGGLHHTILENPEVGERVKEILVD